MVDIDRIMKDLKEREVRFVQIISHESILMALDLQGNLWELNVDTVDNITGKVTRIWVRVDYPRKG